MSPRVYPRGVFKFRSIEDAQAARQRVARGQHGQEAIEARRGDWIRSPSDA